MSINRILKIAAVGGSIALIGISSAQAGTWGDYHPRRAEVNDRLADQDARIDRAYFDGRISADQAQFLHGEDRNIRTQERFDTRFDGGDITLAEQQALNQEEDGVSRQIYRDAH